MFKEWNKDDNALPCQAWSLEVGTVAQTGVGMGFPSLDLSLLERRHCSPHAQNGSLTMYTVLSALQHLPWENEDKENTFSLSQNGLSAVGISLGANNTAPFL